MMWAKEKPETLLSPTGSFQEAGVGVGACELGLAENAGA